MEPTYKQLKEQVSRLEKKIEQLKSQQIEPLEGSEEKYRLLWETMTQGVIYQAANGDILLANPGAERVLGLTADQMQGKSSMDPRWKMIKEDGTPVPGKDHPTMLCLKTGKKIGPVIRGVFHPAKNSYVWLSITSIPIFRAGEKEPYQAYATFDDITESKKAKDKFKKSQEILRYALDSVKLGAWELDLNTHNANRTLQHDKIFGYKKMLPHWSFNVFIEHVHPDDVDEVKKKFDDAVRLQKDWNFECRIIRVDGEERWIWATGQHLKDEAGKYSRMAGIVQDITQQKKSKLELQHREQLLAYIIKHDPSAIAVHDKNLNYLFVSDRYLHDYKVKDSDIIGKHHYEVFPDIPEKWRKVHQRALKGEVIRSEEDVYKKQDGTIDYTRWLCRPWHTEKGEIGGIVLFTEVITERKLIELENMKTAQQLNLVLENTGDGIFSVDKQDRATMINSPALKMLGYSSNDLLGKIMHKAHHHTQKDGSPYPMKECPIILTIEHGKPVTVTDEVFWRKDGTSFPVEYMSAPIIDGDKINGAVVSFRDITFKKKTEKKIQKLNDQLLEIIKTINRLSRAEDIKLLQSIVANAARKLVNARGTTFVIRDNGFCRYVEEDTDTPLWKGSRFSLDNCITGWVMLNKQPAIIEDIYQDDRIPVELYKKTFVKSLAVFPANYKNPKFALGCYWDKHYTPDEQEIQLMKTLAEGANIAYENITLLKNLEEHVKERTLELKQVNKELKAFSYSVSHDLKAPLRAITGFTNILTEDYGKQLDNEGLRLCQTIADNAKNMSKLIDDLLSFSRLARKELKKDFIDMDNLVHKTLQDLTHDARNKDIQTRVKHLDPCYGDPNLIKQVVTNILSNAIKYTTKEETPEIEVFSESDKKETVYYFKDNGVGFDMNYKDKLFGVFQRLHNDSEFEGTGVGLALVQRIIHRHGGIVDGEGKHGQGAKFWFSLPRITE